MHKTTVAIITAACLTGAVCAQPGRPHGPPQPWHFPAPGHGPHRSGPGHHGSGPIPWLPAPAIPVFLGGLTYFLCAGVFYQWTSQGYIMVDPPPRLVSIPGGAERLLIDGVVYYRVGATYYKATPYEYVVVERPAQIVEVRPAVTVAATAVPVMMAIPATATVVTPAVAPAPSAAVVVNTDMAGALIINVPNKNGQGFTAVTLKKNADGYIGPQGEYYSAMPSVRQLTEMYGQ